MFKSVSLAKKIPGGFAVILILLIMLAVAGRMGLTRVVDRVTVANRFQVLMNQVLDARQNEKQFILTNDGGAKKRLEKDVETILAQISKIAGSDADLGFGDIRDIENGVGAYKNAFGRYAAMARQKDTLMADMDQKAGAALGISAKIRDEQKTGYNALMEESETRISQMRLRVGVAERINENFLQAGGYRMAIGEASKPNISMMTQWKGLHTNIKKELADSLSLMAEAAVKTWHGKVAAAQDELIRSAQAFFNDKSRKNNQAVITSAKAMERAVVRFHQELQEPLEFYIEDVRMMSGQMMELSSAADQVANILLHTRVLEKEFIRNEDPAFFNRITETIGGITTRISAAKEAIDDPDKTLPLDGILDAARKYIASFNAYARLMKDQKAVQASMEKAASGVQGICLKAKDEMMTQMEDQIGSSTAVITLVSLGAVIFGFLIALFLTRIIIRPLNKVVDALKDIAQGEGDLTQRIDIDTQDEIGELAKWFNRFISRLNGIIVDIGSNSETLTAASGELLAVSETMAGDSDNLAQRSNSVATAAEEMSVSMNSVAAASNQASANLVTVAGAAEQMKLTLNEVAQSCDTARQVSENAVEGVERTSRRVGRLGASALDISKVTQVITDIADQTNLLALNATIEAARAGEAGKGFAVVANEIKGLAAQTADATLDIKEKIRGIQESTDDTVKDVAQITQVISEVTGIVSTIAAAIEQQSASAAEVAQNIDQASAGIGEVNENVALSSQTSMEIAGDISIVKDVSVEMTGQSTRMTRSAKELSELSGRVMDMIGVFKVSVEEGDAPVAEGLGAEGIPDFMPWGDRLMIGLTQVDDQHKELVSMVNELHRAMKMKIGARQAGDILQRLAEYTVYHFGFEEKLFDEHGYPETLSHKKIHKDLVAKVVKIQADFNAGKAALSIELMDFLTQWLREHIMKTDKAYVPFLKEKGVE